MNDTPESQDRNKDAMPSCGDVRDVLFEYLTRELGEGRSDVVRIHLRRCAACRDEAAEIQRTFELLGDLQRQGDPVPARLSEDRLARIRWAVAHPVLDWIHAHHVFVSIMVALLAGLLCGFALSHLYVRHREALRGITVTIGRGAAPSPTTPPPTPPATPPAPEAGDAR